MIAKHAAVLVITRVRDYGSFRKPRKSTSAEKLKFLISLVALLACPFVSPPSVPAQSKPLKEIRVPYALGGSTSFFWVAQRAGAFEKHGIKVLPIFMRGGREAVQALISRDVTMLQQGSSGVILAWAQGAKDLAVIGATGNKLDYVFVSNPNIKKPADLKGKRVAISQLGASTDFIARLARRASAGPPSPAATSMPRCFSRRSL
jgi:ABC-type nitrate/sulfonate/bicarbonate transport system substrate-binding protein